MSIFNKALQNQKTEKKTKSKGTTWVVQATETVGQSVKAMRQLAIERKAIEAREKMHKGVIKKHADELYISNYVDAGSAPDSPLNLMNSDGDQVTFVVQDRTGQYKVGDDQKEALNALLGEDAAADLMFTNTSFGFDSVILSIPGVMGAVGGAIERAVQELVVSEVLSQSQADGLLTVDQRETFKPKTLDRLVSICGKDTGRVKRFLDVIGSNATRYVKA